MLDHLPSPVHSFPYQAAYHHPILDPARPRHFDPHDYPYPEQQHKSLSHPHSQSLSPLTDCDPDRPFVFDTPRDSDLAGTVHRPSSQSPTLSPPPLSASSEGTYPYDHHQHPGPPFTVSPLNSQPQTFAHSLDRRLSEPAIRSLYTSLPHPSLRPNQLPPLNHPEDQNVAAYSSSPPAHPYSHQRAPSDSSDPWSQSSANQKYPPPPDESDLNTTSVPIALPYDHPDKHEESLSPSLDPASFALSDSELMDKDEFDEKLGMLSGTEKGKDKKTYSFVSLPGNAVKKRPRRRYDEIDRLYRCNFPNCAKAYGTLNHLNAHVTMQKHGQKRSPAEFKELRKQWRQQKKEADEAERQREREQRHMNAYALQHNTSPHHLSSLAHPHLPSHHPHAHLAHPSQLARIGAMQQQGYPTGPFGQRMFPRGVAGSMPGMPGVNTSPVRLYAPPPYSQQAGQPQSPSDSLSSPTFIGDVYSQQQQQQEGFDAYTHSQILRRSSMGDFGNVGEEGVGPMRQAPQARTRRLSLHPYAQGASMSSPERYFATSSSAPSAGLSGRFAQSQQAGEQQQQPQGDEEFAHYSTSGAVNVRRPPQGAGGIDMVSSSPTGGASLSMVGGVTGMGVGGMGTGGVGGWGMRSAPASTTTFAFTIPDQQHQGQQHPHPSHPHAHSNPHAHTHPHAHAQQQHEGPSPPASSHGLPSLPSHPTLTQHHPSHPHSAHSHQSHPHPGQSNTPSNSNGEPLLTSHVALGSNRLPLNSTLLTPLPGYDEQPGSRPGTGRSDLSAGGGEFERQQQQQQQQMGQVGYWRERDEF